MRRPVPESPACRSGPPHAPRRIQHLARADEQPGLGRTHAPAKQERWKHRVRTGRAALPMPTRLKFVMRAGRRHTHTHTHTRARAHTYTQRQIKLPVTRARTHRHTRSATHEHSQLSNKTPRRSPTAGCGVRNSTGPECHKNTSTHSAVDSITWTQRLHVESRAANKGDSTAAQRTQRRSAVTVRLGRLKRAPPADGNKLWALRTCRPRLHKTPPPQRNVGRAARPRSGQPIKWQLLVLNPSEPPTRELQ